jgi:hypothetical protein
VVLKGVLEAEQAREVAFNEVQSAFSNTYMVGDVVGSYNHEVIEQAGCQERARVFCVPCDNKKRSVACCKSKLKMPSKVYKKRS